MTHALGEMGVRLDGEGQVKTCTESVTFQQSASGPRTSAYLRQLITRYPQHSRVGMGALYPGTRRVVSQLGLVN
jgi:hypothetical protein